jgi:hypothetical protein
LEEGQVKAWKAALAASVAAAAIALIVVAPMAQSSKSHGGLKVVSVTRSGLSGPNAATAKCPRGFVAIAGGFEGQQVDVRSSEKRDERHWTVTAVAPPGKRGELLTAQAICAKGTGGFRVSDAGNR